MGASLRRLYCTHTVLGVEFLANEQREFPLWENLVLVWAFSAQEALELGRSAGQFAAEANKDSGFRWAGVPAEWKFLGMRVVSPCRIWRHGDGLGFLASAVDFRVRDSKKLAGFMFDDEVEVLAPSTVGVDSLGEFMLPVGHVTGMDWQRILGASSHVGHLTFMRRIQDDLWGVQVKEIVATLPSQEGSVKEVASALAANLVGTLNTDLNADADRLWEYVGLRKVLRLPDSISEGGEELTWLQLFARDPQARFEYSQGHQARLVFDDQV